jgi:hypothetical protein
METSTMIIVGGGLAIAGAGAYLLLRKRPLLPGVPGAAGVPLNGPINVVPASYNDPNPTPPTRLPPEVMAAKTNAFGSLAAFFPSAAAAADLSLGRPIAPAPEPMRGSPPPTSIATVQSAAKVAATLPPAGTTTVGNLASQPLPDPPRPAPPPPPPPPTIAAMVVPPPPAMSRAPIAATTKPVKVPAPAYSPVAPPAPLPAVVFTARAGAGHL